MCQFVLQRVMQYQELHLLWEIKLMQQSPVLSCFIILISIHSLYFLFSFLVFKTHWHFLLGDVY